MVDTGVVRTVRRWVERQLPGERALAVRAGRAAEEALDHGASRDEAVEEARAFVSSWVHHPSHGPVAPELAPPLAS